MRCCGWTGPGNWSDNLIIKNSSQNLYPCSCRNESLPGSDVKPEGLCEHLSTDLPVFETVRNPLSSAQTHQRLSLELILDWNSTPCDFLRLIFLLKMEEKPGVFAQHDFVANRREGLLFCCALQKLHSPHFLSSAKPCYSSPH